MLISTMLLLLSCSVISESLQPHGLWPIRLLCPSDSLGKNIGEGHACLQGSNPNLLHCRQILDHLSHHLIL